MNLKEIMELIDKVADRGIAAVEVEQAGTKLRIEGKQASPAPQVIHSMETGQERVIYGNVRNTGLITNLPADICVEVPCLIDRTGLSPVHVGDVAPQCAALNRTFANVCDLTVRAVLDGRRDHVHHAAMLDPNTAASLTLDQIDALVEELLAAYAPLLPESLR